jgi:shikimate dehydrogenase
MKFGLIGYPIAHSMSPALFRAGYPGSVHSYELFPANNIEEAFSFIRDRNIDGVNITTPFKESVLKYAQERDTLVNEIEASNLLMRIGNGFNAYNTDYYGVKDSLIKFVNVGERVVIVGCGGAGRAAAIAARNLGFDVVILNRDQKKAQNFAEKNFLEFAGIEQFPKIAGDAKIIIDTLPVLSNIYDSINLKSKIVFEAKYSQTELNTKCHKEGAVYIPGTVWLLNQAVPSFRIFTGEEPNRSAMELLAESC